MTNLTVTNTETISLFGWGTFEEHERTIRARVFGQLVRLAQPVIEEFHLDLYHDAHWIDEYVNGETEFWFAVRTSGTHIGDTALIAAEMGGMRGLVLYRVALTCDERLSWTLTIETTEVSR